MMGLFLLAGKKKFFALMPISVIQLIIIGGVLYCTGIVFYIWKKNTYHHGVWYLFVLAAAILHYFALLITVG